MANVHLELDLIAKESALRLRNVLVMRQLVHTDHSSTFQKLGDKIQVRIPPTYTADEWDGATLDIQDISNLSVDVELDTVADVSVEITAKEMALNIDDFGQQYLQPAMEAIAQSIDAKLHTLYKDIYSYSGVSGTTPAALSNIAQAGKLLSQQQAPMSRRRCVMDPEAHAALIILDIFARADASDTTQGLREALLGRALAMDTFMSQNVITHTAGLFVPATTPLADAASVGASALGISSSSGTGTLLKGDIFTIAHTVLGATQYTVAATTASAAANDIAIVTISPTLQEATAGTEAIVFKDASALAHTPNLCFHRNAFAFVSRAQSLPAGGAKGSLASFEGLTVRATADYDMDAKKDILSLDVLYGVKTIQPELATRMLG